MIREFIDGTIQGTSADHLVNLAHIFAEHLVSLKRKAFTGTCAKESVGSLLTKIFRHPGIHLVQTTVKRDMYFMDETQLKSVQWLKDGRLGFFIDKIGPHLIELPNRKATNFDGCRSRLDFRPDLLFLLNPPVRLRRQAGTHAAAAPAEDSDPLALQLLLFHLLLLFLTSLIFQRYPSWTMETFSATWWTLFRPSGPGLRLY